MILHKSLDRGDFQVFFTVHALTQAVRRGLDWEEIEQTVRTGKFKRLRNYRVNIEKRTAKGITICIGIEFRPNKIKIVTVERNEWKT